MAADLEREARRLASARNHALVTCHAQGCQALGGEHVAPRLPLPLQAAQGAELAPTDRVDAGRPALGAAHMQLASPEIDIVPAQGDKLAARSARSPGRGEARNSKICLRMPLYWLCYRHNNQISSSLGLNPFTLVCVCACRIG